MMLVLLPLLAIAHSPAAAAPPVEAPVASAIAQAAQGTRLGLLVVDEEGREVVAIRPDERFVPASNTKLYTTAAAFALLETSGAEARLDRPLAEAV